MVGEGFQVAGYRRGHEFTAAWDANTQLCCRGFEKEVVDVFRERCDGKTAYQSKENMANHNRA